MSRPVSLTIAVVLQWVAAVIAAISGFDLMAAAFEMSSDGVQSSLEAALAAEGVTDIAGSLIVIGVFLAGVLVTAIAVLRVMVAYYLGMGRNWARIIVTVLVALNLLGGFGYLFQGYVLRASLTIPLELLVLWLLYNERSSAFIKQSSLQPARPLVTLPADSATLSA
jgi:hypothetical protein